jgi:hypothetical protein
MPHCSPLRLFIPNSLQAYRHTAISSFPSEGSAYDICDQPCLPSPWLSFGSEYSPAAPATLSGRSSGTVCRRQGHSCCVREHLQHCSLLHGYSCTESVQHQFLLTVWIVTHIYTETSLLTACMAWNFSLLHGAPGQGTVIVYILQAYQIPHTSVRQPVFITPIKTKAKY